MISIEELKLKLSENNKIPLCMDQIKPNLLMCKLSEFDYLEVKDNQCIY